MFSKMPQKGDPCIGCNKPVRNPGTSWAAWGDVFCGLRCAHNVGTDRLKQRAAQQREVRQRVNAHRKQIEKEAERRITEARREMGEVG